MKALQVIKLVLLVLTIPLLWGCSNDKLTRGKAEKLIREMYKFPFDENRDFHIEGGERSTYDKLQNEGLLTYTEYFYFGSHLQGELTEKGKQYVVSAVKSGDAYNKYIVVKAATLDFGEITGIVEYKESNTAVVNYTYIRKNLTPFGRIAFYLQEGPNNYSHTFTKYDDGWRINNSGDKTKGRNK